MAQYFNLRSLQCSWLEPAPRRVFYISFTQYCLKRSPQSGLAKASDKISGPY